jgi:hypothetical protein
VLLRDKSAPGACFVVSCVTLTKFLYLKLLDDNSG